MQLNFLSGGPCPAFHCKFSLYRIANITCNKPLFNIWTINVLIIKVFDFPILINGIIIIQRIST